MSFYDHLDPQIREIAREQGMPHQEAFLFSIAVSLRDISFAMSALSQCVGYTGYGTAIQTKDIDRH